MNRIWIKPVLYVGAPVLIACDGRCSHAWGRRRPRTELDPDEPDDYVAASDDDAGPCPLTGMELDADGGDTKPDSPADMNRWCARSCERSVLVNTSMGVVTSIDLPDWSRQRFNMPSRHPDNEPAPGGSPASKEQTC